jgi:hypothetical protein
MNNEKRQEINRQIVERMRWGESLDMPVTNPGFSLRPPIKKDPRALSFGLKSQRIDCALCKGKVTTGETKCLRCDGRGYLNKSEFTCWKCDNRDTCPQAYSQFNLNGDCQKRGG